jgi:hypothetical protein
MGPSLLAFIGLCVASGVPLHAATVTTQAWGKDTAGNAVDLYTLKEQNAEVQLTTYGARIVSIRVPDKTGQMSSVVLGLLIWKVTFKGAYHSKEPPSAVLQTESREASSTWVERHTKFRKITGPMPYTARQSASTRGCGVPSRLKTAWS